MGNTNSGVAGKRREAAPQRQRVRESKAPADIASSSEDEDMSLHGPADVNPMSLETANPAGAGAMPRGSSARSSSAVQRARSSFAAELEGHSMDMGHGGADLLACFQPPHGLEPCYAFLACLQPSTPVPLTTLQKLWQMDSQEALTTAAQLEAAGAMKSVVLDDGTVWAVVIPAHAAHLQTLVNTKQLRQMHAVLLDAYTYSGRALCTDIPDDGYIWSALSHHLAGAQLSSDLRELLFNLSWLEQLLLQYGVQPCVQAFKGYLSIQPKDQDVKLLCHAFQLTLGSCAGHSGVRLLRQQMLARLMAATQPGRPYTRESFERTNSFARTHSTSLTHYMAYRKQRTLSGLQHMNSSNLGPVHEKRVPSGSPLTQSMLPLADASTSMQPTSQQGRTSSETVSSCSDAKGDRTSMTIIQPTKQMATWFREESRRLWNELHRSSGAVVTGPIHLMPRSASLMQAGALQRTAMRSHTCPVHKVLLVGTGSEVITISQDGTACVFDMEVGDCTAQMPIGVPLTDADCGPGKSILCLGAENGGVYVWDLVAGQIRSVLRGHNGRVNSVAVDCRGLRALSGGEDGRVCLWGLQQGQLLRTLHGDTGGQSASAVLCVAFSKDCRMAAAAAEDFLSVWDVGEDPGRGSALGFSLGRLDLQGHSGWVVSLAFLGTTHNLVSASHDGTARVWDGDTGKCLRVLQGHEGRLNKVVVDPTGTYAITCSDDTSARVWELSSGQCTGSLQGHGAWVSNAALLPGGARAVTVGGDGVGRVWDVASGTSIRQLEGHSDCIRGLAITARGRFVVTSSDDGCTRVWDLATFADSLAVPGHKGRVRLLVPLPGLQRVVSGGDDGTVCVWDCASGLQDLQLHGNPSAVTHLQVALPDGSCDSAGDGSSAHIVAASGNRCMHVWDADEGKVLHQMPPSAGSRVKDVSFSKNGLRAAVLLWDSSVTILDLTTGDVVVQLMSRTRQVAAPGADGVTATAAPHAGHAGGVNGVILTGDGKTAITYAKDCTACVWDVETGRVIGVATGHEDGIHTACLSPDESLLATASYTPVVRLHRLPDCSPAAVLQHRGPVAKLAFAPNNCMLACVVNDLQQVAMWDVAARVPMHSLAGHTGDITDVAFSPDSQLLATCSADNTLRVWNTRARVRTLRAAPALQHSPTSMFTPSSLLAGDGLDGGPAACSPMRAAGGAGSTAFRGAAGGRASLEAEQQPQQVVEACTLQALFVADAGLSAVCWSEAAAAVPASVQPDAAAMTNERREALFAPLLADALGSWGAASPESSLSAATSGIPTAHVLLQQMHHQYGGMQRARGTAGLAASPAGAEEEEGGDPGGLVCVVGDAKGMLHFLDASVVP